MVPVYFSERAINLDRLKVLPRAHLVNLWDGKAASRSISYCVAFDHQALYLLAGFPAGTTRNPTEKGNFFEGLWKRDVLEVFIGKAGSESYDEIHLSPSGEWWSCSFSAPRARIAGEKPSVEAESFETSAGPEAILRFPYRHLLPNEMTINVCGNIGSPPELLSATIVTGEQANFHQPGLFRAPLALSLAAG